MRGSKLHSTVQWKGTAQFPSSFMSVAVVFLHVGTEAAHCTPAMLLLMPVKVLREQGTVKLFISGLTLFFL